MRKLYQRLYTTTDYGKASAGKCPGVRFFPLYKKHVVSPFVDLGCGNGDTVIMLRQLGFNGTGIDQISLDNGLEVGDITKPHNLEVFETALCIDVLEHLEKEQIVKVFENLTTTKKQVLSVHTKSSQYGGGLELHLTQEPFEWWESVIEKYLIIEEKITTMTDVRRLYLTRSKAL